MAIERSTELLDVLERVLDRGVVIDAWVTVSLAGVRLIDVEARILVASVSTYLRLADAVASKPAAMAKPFAATLPPAVPAPRLTPPPRAGGCLDHTGLRPGLHVPARQSNEASAHRRSVSLPKGEPL